LQGELVGESSVEFPRRPVGSPDCASVHADGNHPARKADSDPRPVASPRVVADLPRTPPAYDGEDEPPASPDQTGALAGDGTQIGQAVERSEIGVRAIVRRPS